jgi:hypothetical protein
VRGAPDLLTYLFIYLFIYLLISSFIIVTAFSRSGKKRDTEEHHGELSFSVIPCDIEELKVMWGIKEGSLDLASQPLSLNDPCFVYLGGIHFCGIESVV